MADKVTIKAWINFLLIQARTRLKRVIYQQRRLTTICDHRETYNKAKRTISFSYGTISNRFEEGIFAYLILSIIVTNETFKALNSTFLTLP